MKVKFIENQDTQIVNQMFQDDPVWSVEIFNVLKYREVWLNW